MYGEGNWKADAEYRQGIKEFSQTHDAEQTGRGAAAELDDEGEGSEAPPSKDENEW
ncbi:MAG TPA: hypothetical protein VE007_09295 [Thermoanaerobaculia bacterium]|nr:hypothetical protein [Thermoanaerobaculia bacterium]